MKKILPCIIGLGYVGLPVFISLKKKFNVVGYDINERRIKNLKNLIDTNKEFEKNELKIKNKSFLTSDSKDIKNCNFYIVTVPTPVKNSNKPNLKYIKNAFEVISKNLKKDDIIFLESTVYPNTTEVFCKNILLKNKNLISSDEFTIGYSSERINPGDKEHNVKKINKVVAVETNENIIKRVKLVYSQISKKIIFSKKIREAELSKLVENTQRDINISLMNEILILCRKTNINFNEVLRLARTKWNFLNFSPGLVGGHCLPVDPYYLSYFAKTSKFNTKITLAGRETNNSMENFIFKLIKREIGENIKIKNKKIAVIGLTYKPNVSDIRNSLALKIFNKLRKKYKNIVGFDPILDKKIAKKINITQNFNKIKNSNIIIVLVNHNIVKKKINFFSKPNKMIINPFNYYSI
tara:strand:- start:7621 stop:8847 length:1227 start_codon:yes stop_codon:yes gene_type:complete